MHLALQVVFQLHPSFDNPTREYMHPPYEITETGWGEFEIAVIVNFAVCFWGSCNNSLKES